MHFLIYDNMDLTTDELELRTSHLLDEMKVNGSERKNLNTFLDIIKLEDPSTHAHSLRVGLLLHEIVRDKAGLYAGDLHDIGKIVENKSLLAKPGKFSHQEYEQMKAHVLNGYRIIQGVYDFSAMALLWHHYFKKDDPYPKKKDIQVILADMPSKRIMESKRLGLYLAMADCYDAMLNRNDREEHKLLSYSEQKRRMLEEFPRYKNLVNELFMMKIFGVDYRMLFKIDSAALKFSSFMPNPVVDMSARQGFVPIE